MKVADLVLRYLHAAAWPLVVSGALFGFRRQLTALLRRDIEATVGSFSVRVAAEIENAAQIAEALPKPDVLRLGTEFPSPTVIVTEDGDERAYLPEDRTEAPVDEQSDGADAVKAPAPAPAPAAAADRATRHVTASDSASAWEHATATVHRSVAGIWIPEPPDLAAVLIVWRQIERLSAMLAGRLGLGPKRSRVVDVVSAARERGLVRPEVVDLARALARARNELVHGSPDDLLPSQADSLVSSMMSLHEALVAATISKGDQPPG